MADVSQKGVGGWIRNLPTFVQQVRAETAKVVWPSWPETWKTGAMVVAMTLILGIFFFVVDWGFSRIVAFLVRLAG